MKIGVIDRHASVWTAGRVFTRILAHSLAAAAPERGHEVSLLTRDPDLSIPRVSTIRLPSFTPLPGTRFVRRLLKRESERPLPGEGKLRRALGISEDDALVRIAKQNGVHVLLPFPGPAPKRSADDPRIVTWIPDFQHTRLPQMFSDEERLGRTRGYMAMLKSADATILSSHAVERDCLEFAPETAAKLRIAPFPSIFAFEPPDWADPRTVVEKYHLPPKFLLVANQFWKHKNHRTVVEALALLRASGLAVPTVMVGLPSDYRDPENNVLSEILQGIAVGNLSGTVIVLGRVPFRDLVGLLRGAAAVVQPSLFEGWSTTIEDAKALGRPIVASDIAVHREQVPEATIFFNPLDARALADSLRRVWPALAPGPDADRERSALEKVRAAARIHGQTLLEAFEALGR